MPHRPRSHKLEDESRRTFASQLPTSWTVQDLAPDYGLDQRVEIFDSDGKATGLVFYVQLKSTDAPDNTRNRQIRVRADHYDYWHSLSDPVLLALYFSQSRATYVRWAHRFHPELRAEGEFGERFTIKFTRSSCWHPADNAWVVREIINIREVSRGVVHFPLEIGVSESPDIPLKGSSLNTVLAELKGATSRSDLRWHVGDDRSDVYHLYIGEKKVMARAGKVIYSITSLSAGIFPDDFPKTDAALFCLGLAVAMAGASSPGMHLLSRYGKISREFFGVWGAQVIQTAAMRSRHFDLAMDLIEAWLAEGKAKATETAIALYGSLWILGVTQGISERERRRLEELRQHEALRMISEESIHSLQLGAAVEFGEQGFLKEAIELFEYIFADSGWLSNTLADTVVRASRWAVKSGEYELAEQWIRAIEDRQPNIEASLLLVKALIMQGRYLEALINLHLAADEHERRGRLLLTGFLLYLILAIVKEGRQERNPQQVLAITRSLVDEENSKELWLAFLEAIRRDAASPVTWSLINVINALEAESDNNGRTICDDDMADKTREFILGFGIFGPPVLAEVDADKWAIACAMLLSRGYMQGFLHAIDYALDVCPESFHETLAKGYPDRTMAGTISRFATVVEAARQENGYVRLREAPEKLDLLKVHNPIFTVAYAVEQVNSKGVKEVSFLGANRHFEDDSLYLGWRTIATTVLGAISDRSDTDDGANG
jgi:tetratricopeptide (TPR) repeat protein